MLLEPDITALGQGRRVTPAVTMSIAVHGAVLLALVVLVQSQISQISEPAPKTLREVVLLPDMRPPSMGGGNPAPAKPKPVETPVVVMAPTPIPTVEPESIAPEPESPAPVVAASPGPPAVATGESAGGDGTAGDGAPGVGGPGPGGPAAGGTVYGIGNGVSSPIPTRRPPPAYTAAAMKARLHGIAVLTCVVRPDGTCSDIRIVRSLDANLGLDEQAIASAKQWRFRPGMRQGEAVPVQVTLEIEFNIR